MNIASVRAHRRDAYQLSFIGYARSVQSVKQGVLDFESQRLSEMLTRSDMQVKAAGHVVDRWDQSDDSQGGQPYNARKRERLKHLLLHTDRETSRKPLIYLPISASDIMRGPFVPTAFDTSRASPYSISYP